VWVPVEREKYKKQREETELLLGTLGKVPSSIQIGDLLGYANMLLLAIFTPTWIDELCTKAIANLNLPQETQTATTFEAMLEQKKVFQKTMECLANNTLIQNIRQIILDHIRLCCNNDKTGDFQLCRFPIVRDGLVTSAQAYFEKEMTEFTSQAQARLDIIYLFPSTEKKHILVQHVLTQCLITLFLIPLLDSLSTASKLLPFVDDTFHNMPLVPSESEERALERQKCEKKLQNIKHIEDTLIKLAS